MRKLTLSLYLLLVFAVCASAQTNVDGLMNLNLTSPSAPGTTLTPTILNNGSVGSAITSWGAMTGTGSAMTVGTHNPACPLGLPISIGSQTYAAGLPSQAFAMNMASNNTYASMNVSAGSGRITVVSGCWTVPTSASNVMDIISFEDSARGFTTWLQFVQGSSCNGGSTVGLRIEGQVGGTNTTRCQTLTGGGTYILVMKDDFVNGQSALAIFNSSPPYAQVGTTITNTEFVDSGHVDLIRLGNAEIGTSSSTMKIENFMVDNTSGGASFPTFGVPSSYPPWQSVVSPTRAIDWSQAGVTGGIPTGRTQCVTTACNTVVSAGSAATATQINSAISGAPANTYVQLGSGTFNVTSQIVFSGKSNVTLRGNGANNTILAINGSPASCGEGLPTGVCSRAVDGNYSGGPTNTANWTAGYLRGNTVITLSSVTNLKVGNYVILDQLDDTAWGCDNGQPIVSDITTACTSGSPTSPGINGPYSGVGNGGGARSGRSQQQIVKVTKCDGNSTVGHACSSGSNITISPGLYMANWNASPGNSLPQAWWATSPSSGIGIEDLTIDNTNNAAPSPGQSACSSGSIAVAFYNSPDSWLKGVRIIEGGRAHVSLAWSAHVTIRDNYLYLGQYGGTFSGTSGSSNVTGCSYGIENYASSDALIENNITQGVTSPFLLNGPFSGGVIDYNFSKFPFLLQSLTGSNTQGDHDAGDDSVLIEGNIGFQKVADIVHGTHNLITLFRNRFTGADTCWQSSTDISTTALAISTGTFAPCTGSGGWGFRPVMLDSFSRGYNVAGNVLGTTGNQTAYLEAPSLSNCGITNAVLALGCVHNAYSISNDVNVQNTAMLWGNVDSATGFASPRFNSSEVPSGLTNRYQQFYATPVPVNNTLPASFVYSSQPSWWPSGKAWPPIGPDVTGGNISGVNGHAYTIPAQDCATAMGMPSNGVSGVLGFDPLTCYSGGGGSVVRGCTENLTTNPVIGVSAAKKACQP